MEKVLLWTAAGAAVVGAVFAGVAAFRNPSKENEKAKKEGTKPV